MPAVTTRDLPNYLISCSSKRLNRRSPNFDSTRKTPQIRLTPIKPGSALSSCESTRASSQAEIETNGYVYVSKFRILYDQKYFPFEVDYSTEPRSAKQKMHIAWKDTIQSINVKHILPELIEGYEDSNKKIHRIVDAAMTDLLRHATFAQLVDTINVTRDPIKRLLMSNNKEAVFRGLKTFQEILRVVQKVRSIAPEVFRSLLIPINTYYINYHSGQDMDVQRRKGMLETVDKTLNIIESFSINYHQRWKYAKGVQVAYRGFASQLTPERNAAMGLRPLTDEQQEISNCLTFRRHHDPRGWRQIKRFNLAAHCRHILSSMPWIVPKSSNYYLPEDDIRIIDLNVS